MGEQLEKTGPKAAPTKIGPYQVSFCSASSKILSDLELKPNLSEMLSQISGNKLKKPKIKKTEPDKKDQTYCGTPIKLVETFRVRVKTKIELTKPKTINNGRSLFFPPTEPPIKTGKTGKTQGAKTVKNPAIKEIINSVIIKLNLKNLPLPRGWLWYKVGG